jgi:FkbM family methyltransferase
MLIPDEVQRTGIDFVDVGCSGDLDQAWQPLAPVLNLVGFDPDAQACQHLNQAPSRLRSRRYLPFAIAGEEGSLPLTLTKSSHCASLLKPRQAWLARFDYWELFAETGSATVRCTTLDLLRKSEGLRADVLKLDTQGMELPILGAAAELLTDVICVHTETGFVENYVGESVAARVDEFLRHRGFLLFDMKTYPVGRRNAYATVGRHQPLWCECLWLRDYLSEGSFGIPAPPVDRLTALKVVFLASALGYLDYAMEMGAHFEAKGLLAGGDYLPLLRSGDLSLGIGSFLLRLLPYCVREYLYRELLACRQQPHVLKSIFRKPRRV